MSRHRSYKSSNAKGSSRNVLTRWERLAILKTRGYKGSVLGLPKTKTV